MKKKKVYIFVVITVIILFILFNVKYAKGVEVGTWGRNRSINWR